MQASGPNGQTPFASSQVDFGSNAAPSSANSLEVLTIVFGLVAVIGMGLLVVLFMLLLGIYGVVGPGAGDDGIAKGRDHVRDTGVVADPTQRKRTYRPRGPVAPVEKTEEEKMSELFGGLGAGPVTVVAEGPGKEAYYSIEVICSMVSFRERADLVGDRAYIPVVPAARCRLVFQGRVPVKSWVTGGDRVKCTFEPIVCKRF